MKSRRDRTREEILDIVNNDGKTNAIMDIIDALVEVIHAEAFQGGMEHAMEVFKNKKERV